MAAYGKFKGPVGTVTVEVENVGGSAASSPDLATLFTPIPDLAKSLGVQLASLSEKERPQVVELTFALKALSDGRVAVTLAGTGSLVCKLTWKAESAGLLSPGDLPLST